MISFSRDLHHSELTPWYCALTCGPTLSFPNFDANVYYRKKIMAAPSSYS